MPLAVQSSIRDQGGCKPFLFYYAITHNSTGAFDDIIFTPLQDRTYNITFLFADYTQGVTSGGLYVALNDSVYNYVVSWNTAPAAGYNIFGSCNVWFEFPQILHMHATVTTQPFTYQINGIGLQYKRGEGVLD